MTALAGIGPGSDLSLPFLYYLSLLLHMPFINNSIDGKKYVQYHLIDGRKAYH